MKYKKFILKEFPRSAVVNSTVYDKSNYVDDFINDVVSKHLNSIVEDPETCFLNSDKDNKIIELSNKVIDESLEKYNISSDSIVDNYLVNVEVIKQEEYERGVADTVLKYQPLLEDASANRSLASLLEEKLFSIVPDQNIDIQIAKISAESIASIAKKLHLVLPANFEEIVIDGLISKLRKFYKEGEITITIHPDRYDFCQEILQSNSIPDKFKDNFHVIKDSKVGLDDCSLEWKNTRLEYNKEQLSQEIEKIIEQLKTVN